jgi:Mce-associated membrane protein
VADEDDVADEQASESNTSESDNGATETAAETADTEEATDATETAPPRSGVRLALVVGVVAALVMGGLIGWLGPRAYQDRQAQQQRNLFVQVGRQAATNLTTIRTAEAEADVQRILDSATGAFYDDFQKRAPAFIEVVKQARSNSEGTVTEAGLESEKNDEGTVLVAVTVKSQNAGAPDLQPRAWRMRLTVQKVDDGAKVSRVEYIP